MRIRRVLALLLMVAALLPAVHGGAAAAGHATVIPPGGVRASKGTGNTVGTTIYETNPRADGYRHINTPATIARLKSMGLNTFLLRRMGFPEGLGRPTAGVRAGGDERRAGTFWVYLAPPSECLLVPEGNCPRPYKMDFISWAKAIANLSIQYPNVKAWAIDDFFASDDNRKLFTHDYLTQVRAASQAINPNLGFYTTFYLGNAINDAELNTITGVVDGIIFPYLGNDTDTQDPTFLTQQLNQIIPHTSSHHLDLLLLIYAGRFLDAPLAPTEDYVGQVMDAAAPYAADGRIQGIIDYGAPITDDPQVNSDDLAQSGNGRLSLVVPRHKPTPTGSYEQGAKQIAVDPNASSYQLSFYHYDESARVQAVFGYQIKQALINGTVVWESDVEDDPNYRWAQANVPNATLYPLLHGKTTATLTFRLLERKGVGDFPVNVGFDNVRTSGMTVPDADFETPHSWALTRTDISLLPSQDVWFADRPVRIRNAIAARWGGVQQPVSAGPIAPKNLSMYGKGRLKLSLPDLTGTTAGMCTSATQQVKLDPNSPRYELSFWMFDQFYAIPAGTGYHLKDVYITNSTGQHLLSRMDVMYDWGLWMNGQGLWNHMDITEFLKGQSNVTFSFALCEQQGVGDFGVDVGYDNLETVGFQFVNPGFETTAGWTMHNNGPLHAEISTS